MKVNVDYQLANIAIDKFLCGEELNVKERECIQQVLNASIGDLIPSKEELKFQELNVKALNNTNPDNKSRWNSLMADINNFENKYC